MARTVSGAGGTLLKYRDGGLRTRAGSGGLGETSGVLGLVSGDALKPGNFLSVFRYSLAFFLVVVGSGRRNAGTGRGLFTLLDDPLAMRVLLRAVTGLAK